jgi:hypothetical protein
MTIPKKVHNNFRLIVSSSASTLETAHVYLASGLITKII